MENRPSKVLIVDDSPGDIRILANLLAGMATMMFATTGEEALAKAAEEDFDVILLDIMLPDMDGFEVFRRLNARSVGGPTPVIFVTVLDDEASEETGLLLGALDYVSKPYVPAIVRARVRNHIELSRTTKALRAANEQLARLAALDPLTSVFNRRQFGAVVRQEIQRAYRKPTPLSLLLIDIDHFKTVNDRFGHAAGDAALVAATGAWQAELRAHDVLGRLGGEEFGVLLPDTDAEQARRVAARLLDVTRSLRFERPGGGQFGVTASIGIAAGCDCSDGLDYDRLMACADSALYEAKNLGRDCAVARAPAQAVRS